MAMAKYIGQQLAIMLPPSFGATFTFSIYTFKGDEGARVKFLFSRDKRTAVLFMTPMTLEGFQCHYTI